MNNSRMQTLILKGIAKRKSMYLSGQFSGTRRRVCVFIKEKTPGEFTVNLELTKICEGRGVFEPNPSQQGLKQECVDISATIARGL